ncbi:hypothetical protein SNE26_02070 [Mucilaginibacter sp. cycad4]|uniref:hypothetical protein n=1 Tax=Mucilaginibacter sp. cycad4 TaxID=3342096 RepID=UPI002AABF71B|nr:hypothetical protein [Mucilaginibacter gossypii]WPV00551.1 hypothetical protein SNE26_02070 [Mucilaginibacter gossypii]
MGGSQIAEEILVMRGWQYAAYSLAALSVTTGKLTIKALPATKPKHEPQVKKGEQPKHSFSLGACLLVASLFTTTQSLSVQHGLAERIITYKDKMKQIIFTHQSYLIIAGFGK